MVVHRAACKCRPGRALRAFDNGFPESARGSKEPCGSATLTHHSQSLTHTAHNRAPSNPCNVYKIEGKRVQQPMI